MNLLFFDSFLHETDKSDKKSVPLPRKTENYVDDQQINIQVRKPVTTTMILHEKDESNRKSFALLCKPRLLLTIETEPFDKYSD